MDWIFENLQLIIVVAGSIAYWLNQRKREKEGQDADYDGDGVPEVKGAPQTEAFEEAERTRKIQEEIRRKILERRGGAAPAPVPVPTVPAPSMQEYREEPEWMGEGPPPRTAPPPLDEAVLARQRALQEQIYALEARRAATKAQAAAKGFPAAEGVQTGTRPYAELPALVTALKQPAALRQAIILREILGPPVALR